jgi:hypothetical protein
MVRQAVAGVVGLGLIGGVGAVAYDKDGTAKVTITDKSGHKETVTIAGGGKSFSCPDGTDAKLEPIDIEAGRAKITLRRVRQSMGTIEKRYPDHRAPTKVVNRYNRLVKREGKLVDAYNSAIDKHNAVLKSDCDPA